MATGKIGFVGGGNMARSLVLGLLATGRDAAGISVADVDGAKLAELTRETGIQAAGTAEIGRDCDVIVLAVKPQSMAAACGELRSALASRSSDEAPIVVSLAAGVALAGVEQLLGGELPLVRCMPNTPALVGAGAAGLFANRLASAEQKCAIEELMNSVGISAWCESEADLDAVTALSGSGPAYFFLFMEALRNAACGLGLDRGLAGEFVSQTALGAAQLARASDDDLARLRARVTSPGGTTEAAIECFERGGLRELVEQSVACAAARARELAEAGA